MLSTQIGHTNYNEYVYTGHISFVQCESQIEREKQSGNVEKVEIDYEGTWKRSGERERESIRRAVEEVDFVEKKITTCTK